MIYDMDYFENGKVTGKSCYENYHWMPEKTIPAVHALIQHLKLRKGDTVVDYGCAKGYYVKAFRLLGIVADGIDISQYAIDNGDIAIKNNLRLLKDNNIMKSMYWRHYDWLFSKDVLEHLSDQELDRFFAQSWSLASRAFHIIPLCRDGKFIMPENELDPSHQQRQDLTWWMSRFQDAGWIIDLFTFEVAGIKEPWTTLYPQGHGFFSLRKGGSK